MSALSVWTNVSPCVMLNIQVVPNAPIPFHSDDTRPVTVLGDSWQDVAVSVEILVEGAGGAGPSRS